MKKRDSSAVRKKGFISLYGIVFLHLALSIISLTIQRIKPLKNKDENLLATEIYAIQKVKYDYFNYLEKDETISYLEYNISVSYEDLNCTILISHKGESKIHALLIYDDINQRIEQYEYLEL